MKAVTSNFKTILSIRKSMAFMLERMPLTAVNTVPAGFSNNIVWNMAHVICVQQLLVNRRAGLPYTEDRAITQNYKPGTFVEGDVDLAFIDQLKHRLVANAEEMEISYNEERFTHYDPFTTRTRMSLDSIEDAISFDLFHEGLHMAYILQLQKAVMKDS